jgi:hypothetical protein
VSYTGTGSNATIGHGLGSTLSMIIQKNLTAGTHSWNVYHKNLTSAVYNLNLNGTFAEFTSATTWNSTAPTSSVFSVGTDTNANESGSGHIAYCFAEKKGFLNLVLTQVMLLLMEHLFILDLNLLFLFVKDQVVEHW